MQAIWRIAVSGLVWGFLLTTGLSLAPVEATASQSALQMRQAADHEVALNWDIVKGRWHQLKGEARKRWGKLTDDEWDQIAGDREKLVGKLQEHYGWTREKTEREVDEAFRRLLSS